MKTQLLQVKGLGAWYVAASALGRDRYASDGQPRPVPKATAARSFIVSKKQSSSGLMTLRAVCESDGVLAEIVDFEWAYVSPLAAKLLGNDAQELIGQRLRARIDEPLERAALLAHYRSVIEDGTSDPIRQAHWVNGSSRMLRHSALRLGEGVLVTLTDVTDQRDEEAPRVQWMRLDCAFDQRLEPEGAKWRP